ncbi:MAG: SDR family oxidoreductase [Oligoflexia bacterium]
MALKILITGASRGFGKQAAEALIFRGHEVLAALRGGEARGKSLFSSGDSSKKALDTGRLHFLDLPMESAQAIKAAAHWIEEHWNGTLDVLVNNAGYGLMGPLEHQSDLQVRQQMEVNFFGPLALTRACIPALKKSATSGRAPRVINVSSIAGLVSFPYYGAYNASKFALEAVSEALLYELAPFGVQVALIEPGGFNTGFNESVEYSTIEPTQDPINSKRLEEFRRRLKNKSDLFGANPQRVTDLIVQLCERRRVELRHVIGRDAWAMRILQRLLPDCWRVRFERWFFDRVFFRT